MVGYVVPLSDDVREDPLVREETLAEQSANHSHPSAEKEI
jgi:hypothetical protein